MAITINKQIEIRIDGSDVETLKSICELARRHFSTNVRIGGDERTIDEYDTRQTNDVENLMQQIFDA
jgi:hypothetical protein